MNANLPMLQLTFEHIEFIYSEGRSHMDMKTVLTQKNRELSISTPLPDDELVLYKAQITEKLSHPFFIRAQLLSETNNIPIDKLMGHSITLKMDVDLSDARYFNGIVTGFNQLSSQDGFNRYEAVVAPWLWLLNLSENCRIFQNKTYLDILDEVFTELGFVNFVIETSGDYAVQDFVVQYNETDFNFVSRIMEQEGIFYYFTHTEDSHTLVLKDSNSLLSHIGNISFYPPEHTATNIAPNVVYSWESFQNAVTGGVRLTDFDFKVPTKSLESVTSDPSTTSLSTLEKFTYPGKYSERDNGSLYTRLLMERENTLSNINMGKSNHRSLSVGIQFKLEDHFREDQNISHLITKASYILQSDHYFSSSTSTDSELYQCHFSTIASTNQFRPQKVASKPNMTGPQTALVVGPEGEDIWTDKYGRIKVRFHWDRMSQGDDNSSCWIRVSQGWAGKKWGQIQIPRIGQEVLVDFLCGDPDKPIVIGSVYNGATMPPYDLPANATQSGIKSRTSKGGNNNYNEFRFEDKKGSEEIHLHAEKDYNIEVKNNKHVCVKKDSVTKVEGDRFHEVLGSTKEEFVGEYRRETKGKETEINFVDKTSITHGFTDETFKGDKVSFHGGTSLETFFGAKNSNSLAATNEFFAGAKASHCAGISHSVFVGLKTDFSYAGTISKSREGNLLEGKTNEISGKKEIYLHVGGASNGSGIIIDEDKITICSKSIILDSRETPIKVVQNGVELAAGDMKIKKGNLLQKGGKTNLG